MSRSIKVDIWSDIACPWCFLGKHRFEAAARQLAQERSDLTIEVGYHSFQLAPDLPQDYDGDHDAYLAERLGWSPEQVQASNRQLQALGAAYGIAYDFATNRIANTRKGHELLHFAKAHGRQAETKERILRAHFSDGAHIGRIETLAGIAEQAGLDRDAAMRALEDGTYSSAVDADKTVAARIGITGVPFFAVDGRFGVSGAQDVDAFRQVLERAADEPPAARAASGPGS